MVKPSVIQYVVQAIQHWPQDWLPVGRASVITGHYHPGFLYVMITGWKVKNKQQQKNIAKYFDLYINMIQI